MNWSCDELDRPSRMITSTVNTSVNTVLEEDGDDEVKGNYVKEGAE